MTAGAADTVGAIGVKPLLGPLLPNALAKDYFNARWLFVPYVTRATGDMLLAGPVDDLRLRPRSPLSLCAVVYELPSISARPCEVGPCSPTTRVQVFPRRLRASDTVGAEEGPERVGACNRSAHAAGIGGTVKGVCSTLAAAGWIVGQSPWEVVHDTC